MGGFLGGPGGPGGGQKTPKKAFFCKKVPKNPKKPEKRAKNPEKTAFFGGFLGVFIAQPCLASFLGRSAQARVLHPNFDFGGNLDSL